MKKQFSITNVVLDRISFRIGEDVGGHSSIQADGIQHGRISCGHCGKGKNKVWCFEYDPLPWYGVITDQEMIDNIRNMDKGYWLPQLVKQSLRVAAEADQLLFMIQKTIELESKSSYEKGRLEQAQTIVKSLGLDHSLVRL